MVMDDSPMTQPSLDEIADQASAGNATAESSLFQALRVRFVSIAKRRVREDDVDDVVQDALRVVHGKYRERSSPPGVLVWSLAILRNVIGNYYQARKRESGRVTLEDGIEGVRAPSAEGVTAAGWPMPGEEMVDQIVAAIETLSRKEPRCGRIFRGILKSLEMGGGSREISGRVLDFVRRDVPEMTRGNFYVALHRCRSHLREILQEMEGNPGQ
jgi:DNA-directed RNA polymerase specialized sigma24 family protein